jgi:hypothetical protein
MMLTDTQRAQAVERYQAGERTGAIAVSFGVSRQAIAALLRRRGVELRTQVKLTPSQRDEAAERYTRGQTSGNIAASLGVTHVTILKVLHRREVVVRGHCTLKHDALDPLTADAAYWCGFLFADGNVHERPGYRPVVSVGLAERDREHLVKLRAFLGSTHAISTVSQKHPACQFRVTSARLAARLLGLGRYEGPIAPELATSRDFWRGVVDGDGSIGRYSKRPGGPRSAQIRLFGERRLIAAFSEFLINDGTTGANLSVRTHKNIYCAGTSGRSATRIIDLLYRDAKTSLSRKAATAQAILHQEAEHEWRLPGRG